MKNLLLAISFFITIQSCWSQTIDTMIMGTDTIFMFTADSPGDSLLSAGDLDGAIRSFKSMFTGQEVHPTELYNYACALSQAYQIDSAFKYLIIANAEDSSTFVLTDPDLLNLRKEKQWNAFETNQIAAIQKKSKNAIKDIDYAKSLWDMLASDQAYYKCIEIAENKIGRGSTVVMALWTLKNKINEQNQIDLEKWIEKKGWPKISQVGKEAAGAAFLVIQHSNNELQKKYIPAIEKLCKENEASWGSYALMYDRIQTHDDKPQKYGSQVRFNPDTDKYELFPLLDETKVDEWRKEAGLGPLADYVAHWDIKWEPKQK